MYSDSRYHSTSSTSDIECATEDSGISQSSHSLTQNLSSLSLSTSFHPPIQQFSPYDYSAYSSYCPSQTADDRTTSISSLESSVDSLRGGSCGNNNNNYETSHHHLHHSSSSSRRSQRPPPPPPPAYHGDHITLLTHSQSSQPASDILASYPPVTANAITKQRLRNFEITKRITEALHRTKHNRDTPVVPPVTLPYHQDPSVRSPHDGFAIQARGPCSHCGEQILSAAEACQAMGKVYHNNCFICCCCKRTLRGKVFYKDQENIYCEEDYLYCGFQKRAEKCASCGHIITDLILQAVNKCYHPGCFRCCVCNECLDGRPFTVDCEQRVFCVQDYHRMFAPRCFKCGLAIMPLAGSDEIIRVVAMDKDFHIDCFHCEDCLMQLTDEQEKRCFPLIEPNIVHLLCRECHIKRKRTERHVPVSVESNDETSPGGGGRPTPPSIGSSNYIRATAPPPLTSSSASSSIPGGTTTASNQRVFHHKVVTIASNENRQSSPSKMIVEGVGGGGGGVGGAGSGGSSGTGGVNTGNNEARMTPPSNTSPPQRRRPSYTSMNAPSGAPAAGSSQSRAFY